MKSFHGAYVAVKQHHAAIRAQELAAWLKLQDTSRSAARARVDSRPEWQEKIKGRPGEGSWDADGKLKGFVQNREAKTQRSWSIQGERDKPLFEEANP